MLNVRSFVHRMVFSSSAIAELGGVSARVRNAPTAAVVAFLSQLGSHPV